MRLARVGAWDGCWRMMETVKADDANGCGTPLTLTAGCIGVPANGCYAWRRIEKDFFSLSIPPNALSLYL